MCEALDATSKAKAGKTGDFALGGQDYAALLLPSVPHLHASLAGGLGDQRGQCARARDGADVREAWRKKAATLHNEHAAR